MTPLLVLPLLVLVGWSAVAAARLGWRDGILVGFLLWLSGWMVGAAALSVVEQFNLAGLVITQVVQLAAQALLLRGARPSLPAVGGAWRDPWIVVLALEAVVLLVLAVSVAPTNWDSMSYHLTKVAQWTQTEQVGPFPAEFAPQVYLPFLAEIGMAQFSLLSGTAWAVNLVQYCAHLTALVAVSVLARNMGIDRRGQAIAAGVFGLAPLVVSQAVTTQTDYVMCTLVLIAYAMATQPRHRHWLVVVALASGLAVAVKPTAVLMVLPAVVWSLRHLRGVSLRQVVLPVAASLAVGVLANVWWMGINQQTWGSVAGPESSLTNEEVSAGVVVGNVVRNLSLHAAGPVDEVNDWIESGVRSGLGSVGIDADDPESTLGSYVVESHPTEDRAGNPVQVVLILIALGALLISRRQRRSLWPVAAAMLVVCVAAAAVLRWQVWGGRFLLTAIALGAVLVGAAMTRWPRWVGLVVLAVLTAQSLPFLLHQQLRPLVGERSVLTTSVEQELFTGRPELAWSYDHIADAVAEMEDPHIGLADGMWQWEYPMWWLIKKANPDATIGTASPCVETTNGEPEPEWDMVVTWESVTGVAYMSPEGCAH